MRDGEETRGRAALRAAGQPCRWPMLALGLFSAFANLLVLTGPLFMVQVYDRVLPSGSKPTLAALFALTAALFLILGVLDAARARLAARIGARVAAGLEPRVLRAGLAGSSGAGPPDLDALRQFHNAPLFLALFDLPWVPLFLLVLALVHPWLGLLALAGGALMAGAALAGQAAGARLAAQAARQGARAEGLAGQFRAEAGPLAAMGMQAAALARWSAARQAAGAAGQQAAEASALWASAGRTFRIFLQSAMLALAALLALDGAVSGGAMLAASVLLGRALAPVEVLAGQWVLVQRARLARDNLARLLGTEEPPPPLPLPRPAARLEIRQVTVTPPGRTQAALRLLSASVGPGQALAVVGLSGAGKSALARCLTGEWAPSGGEIRLDGVPQALFGPDWTRHVGYLPQRVALFDGTVAENIARLDPRPDPQAVLAAARKAGAHGMILGLPQGYDTPLTAGAGGLSGGQAQRIGLARALYGEPALLVLDEPDAGLDAEGVAALLAAVGSLKAEGRAVVLTTQRPATIRGCDLMLVLEDGFRRAFGPAAELWPALRTAAPGRGAA